MNPPLMSRHTRRLLLLVLMLPWLCSGMLLHAQPAAGKYTKRALVVGVADYRSLDPLKNTLNDARLMAETLGEIGFQLQGRAPLLNPGAAELKSAVDSFLNTLDRNTEAVIYFAGHGVQADGDNLLLPKDFALAEGDDAAKTMQQARAQAVVLSDVLSRIERSQASLAVLFLDCCREAGFILRAPGLVQTRGMGAPTLNEGEVLVSFAAKHGQFAMDGEGANGPYAEVLARLLKVPGISINTVLQRVTASVKRATDNRQQPYFYGTLQNEVYLAGDPVDAREAGSQAEAGVGGPGTLGAMLASIAKGQQPEDLQRLMGPPSKTRKPQRAGELLYLSWSGKMFGLQSWYAYKENQWGLVAYVVHLHEARAVPIYHGSEQNMIFVLGKTPLNELRAAGDKPEEFEAGGRYAGMIYHYYFARAGGYWHYLLPARNTAKAQNDASEPMYSFGVVADDDHQLMAEISEFVIAPMAWMEDGM